MNNILRDEFCKKYNLKYMTNIFRDEFYKKKII